MDRQLADSSAFLPRRRPRTSRDRGGGRDAEGNDRDPVRGQQLGQEGRDWQVRSILYPVQAVRRR